jgi:hypothetical protein
MTAEDIIKRFGGTSALARLLDLSVSTVDYWRSENSIPKWRQSRLLELAVEQGIALSTSDFPLPSERKRKVA